MAPWGASIYILLASKHKKVAVLPYPFSPCFDNAMNSLEASHEFVNWFSTYKLFFLSKCPNYGRGGGSDPILSVQTFCVYTSLGAYLVYPYPKKNQYTFINSIVDLVYPKQKHLASIWMIHQKEKLMLIFSILLKKHMYLPGRLVDTPQNLVTSLNLPCRSVDHPLHCSSGPSKIEVD